MWQSVLLLSGTRVFRENHRHFTSHFQQYFSYNVAVSFIIGGNQECSEKTTDILLVTFNNIPVIMWQSVLLLSGTRVFRENHRHFTSHFQQYFSYNVAVSFIIGGNMSTQRKPPTFY
jgi:hypothetical protein